MRTHPGLFLVIEGSDGSGKGTQFELLRKRLDDAGYGVAVFDFPRYEQTSSHFVRKYLNGDYGPAGEVSPYTASLFYALDRYEAAPAIRKALEQGKIVLANRYVGSNMAHQGAKFKEAIDRRSFFVWADSLEFQLLNIPRPTINLYLRVPAEVSYELIAQKSERSYTTKKRDEHEADVAHLRKSVATYDLLCQLFPKDFKAIDCVNGSELMSIKQVGDAIWEAISPLLPPLQKPVAAALQPEPLKRQPQPLIDEEPDAKSGSYEWQISNLSLRAILLLRHAGLSVQINLDSLWIGKGTSYRYFKAALKKGIARRYEETYDRLVETHQHIFSKINDFYRGKGLTKKDAHLQAVNITRQLLPMAALLNCHVTLDKGSVRQIIAKLKVGPDKEMASIVEQLEKIVGQLWPELRRESTAPPESLSQILSSLGELNLPQRLSDAETARLLEAEPKNEFDLLADGIFPFSDLSHDEILAATSAWDYSQKARTLRDALMANPGLLDNVHYRFDMLADRISLLEIMALQAGGNFQLQQATVRYGYEVPADIEAAGIEDEYIQAFDSFLELYSQLQAGEHDLVLLDYCTLAGNRVRCQGRLSGNTLVKALRSSGVDKGLKDSLDELIGATHPIITEFISSLLSQAKQSGGRKRQLGRSRRS